MNKLKFAGFLLAALFVAGKLNAAVPVAPEERSAASRFATSHATMTVLSSGPVTIAAGTGYREVTIFNAANLIGGATVYFREDGFTTLVSTFGFPIYPQQFTSIETQNRIALQINGGPTTSTTIRLRTKQKN